MEVRIPTTIVEVILVEMDRPVMGGCFAIALLRTVPSFPPHGPGRKIDELSVQVMRSEVDDAIGADLAAEVPGRHNSGGEPRGNFRLGQRFDLLQRQRAIRHPGSLEFAVHAVLGEPTLFPCSHPEIGSTLHANRDGVFS